MLREYITVIRCNEVAYNHADHAGVHAEVAKKSI